MREHRVYYGFLKNDHFFVEITKDIYDEWNVQDIRNITHRDIVKWRLRRRERKAKVMLMNLLYIKQGCGDTVKLLKTVKRTDGMKEKEYQEMKYRRYNHWWYGVKSCEFWRWWNTFDSTYINHREKMQMKKGYKYEQYDDKRNIRIDL